MGVEGSSNSSTDCLECRLVSGFGAVGIGAYVYKQSALRKSVWERRLIATISIAIATVGVARLLNVLPKRTNS